MPLSIAFMKTSNAGFSALVDFREELLRPRFFRVREKFLCAVLLDDSAALHEHNAVRHMPREVHLVRHHQHRHALFS